MPWPAEPRKQGRTLPKHRAGHSEGDMTPSLRFLPAVAPAHGSPALAQESHSLPLPTAGAVWPKLPCWPHHLWGGSSCSPVRAPLEPLWLQPLQVPSPSRVINASCHTTSGNKSLLLSSPDEKDVAMEIGDCITALPHAMFFSCCRAFTMWVFSETTDASEEAQTSGKSRDSATSRVR